MKKLKTALSLCKTPEKLALPLALNGFLDWMSDKMLITLLYKAAFGEKPNLENPKTFNEKLQWLKLYDHRPEYTMMADKYAVRKYVADTVGEKYLIPLLGKWDRVEDIDFAALPNQFVLKCNHDQGSVVICRDKSSFDIEAAKKKLKYKLGKNHYKVLREWPYKNIKPCIIAEKLLQNASYNDELSDYKILCFNGEPKLIEYHRGRFRHHTEDFYDTNWRKTDIVRVGTPVSDEIYERPPILEEMLEFARKLSNGIPHVRVDCYCSDGKIYFSELTLYNSAGLGKFNKNYDELLGSWITLPEKTD